MARTGGRQTCDRGFSRVDGIEFVLGNVFSPAIQNAHKDGFLVSGDLVVRLQGLVCGHDGRLCTPEILLVLVS